jgi:hypothetical protein
LETLVQTVALGAIFPKTFTEDWSKEDLSWVDLKISKLIHLGGESTNPQTSVRKRLRVLVEWTSRISLALLNLSCTQLVEAVCSKMWVSLSNSQPQYLEAMSNRTLTTYSGAFNKLPNQTTYKETRATVE